MRTAVQIAAVLLFASAGSAAVAGDRMPDTTYLRAARCQGLAHVAALGVADTSAIDAEMKAQRAKRREPTLLNQAREARLQAQRDGASPVKHARLKAELASRCASWLGAGSTTAAAGVQAGS